MGVLRLTRDGAVLAEAVVTRDPAVFATVPPGGSLQTVYNTAPAGATIELAGGAWTGAQTVTGTKAVTFRARAGETPRFVSLDVKASNTVWRGVHAREMHVTDCTNALFEDCTWDGEGLGSPVLPLYVARVADITWRRCRVGNVDTAKNILIDIRADRLTFEDCLIHDVRVANDTFHNEGMYVNHCRDLVMRRCRFERVATMDCFLTNSGAGQIGKNFRFEDCFFGLTFKKGGVEPHVQTLALNNGLGTIDGLVLLRNHFELGINRGGMSAINSRAQGNTGDMGPPIPGMVYE